MVPPSSLPSYLSLRVKDLFESVCWLPVCNSQSLESRLILIAVFIFFDTVAAAPQAKAMSRGEARQAATVVISYQELMLRTCFATTSQFAAPPHNMQLSDSQTTG